MSSLVRRLPTLSSLCEGTPAVVIRSSLVVAAVAILILGVTHLPEIATTQGELVIGSVLAGAVALQMLVGAIFFPLGCRK